MGTLALGYLTATLYSEPGMDTLALGYLTATLQRTWTAEGITAPQHWQTICVFVIQVLNAEFTLWKWSEETVHQKLTRSKKN